jgi:GNAT superfamily N-acetyltransferase
MFDDLGDELPPGYSIGALRADEIPTLWSWVDAEGWNPGVHDLGAAFAVDPDAFVALRHDDALVGTGSVYSYDGAFGFMGLFVLLPEHRGQGVGGILWRHRHRLVHERLSPGATCGMDGVLPMVPFYERGGFVTAYEDVRWSGAAQGQPDPAAVDLSSVPFEQAAGLRPAAPRLRRLALRAVPRRRPRHRGEDRVHAARPDRRATCPPRRAHPQHRGRRPGRAPGPHPRFRVRPHVRRPAPGRPGQPVLRRDVPRVRLSGRVPLSGRDLPRWRVRSEVRGDPSP